jgi:hypothetical protein
MSVTTTRIGRIWDSRKIRRRVGPYRSVMPVETAFAPYPDWAAFTIVTGSLLR